MRALGVDLGSRRIGLALSDSGGVSAAPLSMLRRSGRQAQDHQAILDAALEHDVDVIVVGLPLNLEGEIGTAARKVLSEVDQLRRAVAGMTPGQPSSLRVEVHDERLTTVTAERALKEGKVRREDRRLEVDKVAAAVMLQGWLNRHGPHRAPE